MFTITIFWISPRKKSGYWLSIYSQLIRGRLQASSRHVSVVLELICPRPTEEYDSSVPHPTLTRTHSLRVTSAVISSSWFWWVRETCADAHTHTHTPTHTHARTHAHTHTPHTWSRPLAHRNTQAHILNQTVLGLLQLRSGLVARFTRSFYITIHTTGTCTTSSLTKKKHGKFPPHRYRRAKGKSELKTVLVTAGLLQLGQKPKNQSSKLKQNHRKKEEKRTENKSA